jgi:hypothetical protein
VERLTKRKRRKIEVDEDEYTETEEYSAEENEADKQREEKRKILRQGDDTKTKLNTLSLVSKSVSIFFKERAFNKSDLHFVWSNLRYVIDRFRMLPQSLRRMPQYYPDTGNKYLPNIHLFTVQNDLPIRHNVCMYLQLKYHYTIT